MRERGHIYQIKETIHIRSGKLDFSHYICDICGAKWYEASDAIARVVSYRFQL